MYIEFVVTSSHRENSQCNKPHCKFYYALNRQISLPHNFFQKIEEAIHSKPFYEAHITLIPKLDKIIIVKEYKYQYTL